jgi:hypothetical protein
VKGKEKLLAYAQHNLEARLKMTVEERYWIMQYKSFPSVRYFWTAYKRALNFMHDTDMFLNCLNHLNFVRSIMRSGLNFEDPNLKIIEG